MGDREFNWPLWVAQEKRYFAKGSIEVKLTPTPNSVLQLTNLIEGKFDIGVTVIDNVIAYMEGQGEAPVSIQPDLFVSMGGDNGLLSLATATVSMSPARLRNRSSIPQNGRIILNRRTKLAGIQARSSRWTFSLRSCRSCASMESVAIGRASSRLSEIGSPVSSQ